MSNSSRKVRIPTLRIMKDEGRKIVTITAYDALTGLWVDQGGADVVLVGDSLGMTALGFNDTIRVTLEMMIHHCAAVARTVKRALIVGDMPFMTYKGSSEQAMAACARLMQEGYAEAVKLEGGIEIAPTIARLVDAGIPVMGHIGLLPQSYHALGGYRLQGNDEPSAERLLNDALRLEQAGVFSLVLEKIPAPLARRISGELKIPTIGIGAGLDCDGQVLVLADMLGMADHAPPKLARVYAEIGKTAGRALAQFGDDVRQGTFPGPENIYG